ncbi:sialidase-3-like [Fundulus heteroclitus]|uniref:sialidase-3-like n=1 Tax=Fundulus heteroclitus TaxID=8078 RepID=UPI00165B77A6|nr:sialidase-3-like [Fundulus heteroclitus]
MDGSYSEEVPQTIFQQKFYRIPAILKVEENLLVFAEQRNGKADEAAERLIMKTGELKKENERYTVKWTEQRVVEEAHIDGYRTMNPCPVYDSANKKVYLFFICVEGTYTEQWQIKNYCNKARLCYITSENLGQTWSGLTELTDLLPENCVTFAVGPGHGLQTENGTLMVPAYVYVGVKPAKPIPRAVSLYSNDSGKSWHFGSLLEEESIECQMAEVSDASGRFIYCNARSKGCYRVEASSDNEGQSFTIHSEKTLCETCCGCQGSVVSFPAQTEAAAEGVATQWLLYTHPRCKCKRCDLGVYLNKTPSDPKAWSKAWILYKGPSAYSDLAYLGDGWFACLFECGKNHETEQIALKIFHFKQVQEGIEGNCCTLF